MHLDDRNQPDALVEATPGGQGWTVAASHEILEMLVDPSGNKLQASRSIQVVGGQIQDGDGDFDYLVELGDPCEADAFAYPIQGVAVSDFITPHFYDPVVTTGTRYSFTGALKAPRQILPGGYISWVNPNTEQWQQLRYFGKPVIVDLGPASGKSLRAWIDGLTAAEVKKHYSPNKELHTHCAASRTKLEAAAVARAARY